MKHKNWFFVVILFILPIIELYSQYAPRQTGSYSGSVSGGLGSEFRFIAPNRVEFTALDSGIFRTGTYTINENSGIQFLNISWNDNTSERYLMLLGNNFICLYGGIFDYLGYHYGPYSEGRFDHLTHMLNISASASLIERNRNYYPTPEKLGLRINSVWAVRGGINEYLLVQLPQQVESFYISIGYVSYTQPYLYKENSRPKKIRVTEVGNESNSMEFELEDTPNFQRISLSNGVRWGATLKIEILEIYPGTKYDDMCINSIMGLFQGN
jgi:hypothetical protein